MRGANIIGIDIAWHVLHAFYALLIIKAMLKGNREGRVEQLFPLN
jgi:hypothetical protein